MEIFGVNSIVQALTQNSENRVGAIFIQFLLLLRKNRVNYK
jgi:hypothetical protein